jgi:cation:H+ antiporter
VIGYLAVVLFIAGVVLSVWSAETLLKGLVGLALAVRVSAFAMGVVLSGLEAENVAVGLAAGNAGAASVALGSVFGGAIFLVCVALGVGAALYPMEVRLPRGFLVVFVLAPVAAGLGVLYPVTPRWIGIVLLSSFAAAMIYLVWRSRREGFLTLSTELGEVGEDRPSVWKGIGLTALGIAAITIAGELVAQGAIGIIGAFGVSALLIGAIVTPAAIEAEEVARQAVPSKRGRHDVAAANLVGTLLYFVLFNFGLIAIITPVPVAWTVRWIDWPFLMGVTVLAAAFLWRGRVGRAAGVSLVVLYGAYVATYVLVL